MSLVEASLSRGAVSLGGGGGWPGWGGGRFWGYRADEASKQKQESLTRDINGRPLQPVAVSPHPNLLCLAPFVERSGSQYHRANVRNALGTTVEVLSSARPRTTLQQVHQV